MIGQAIRHMVYIFDLLSRDDKQKENIRQANKYLQDKTRENPVRKTIYKVLILSDNEKQVCTKSLQSTYLHSLCNLCTIHVVMHQNGRGRPGP